MPHPTSPPPLDVTCDLGTRTPGHHAVWELTAGCNLACLHCAIPRAPIGTRLSPERSAEVFTELVAADVRRLTFSGGEPLLRHDLWSLVGRAVRSGLQVEVLTNGMLLEDADVAAARKAARGGTLILQISLDAARDWVHDGIRGRRGAYDATIQGIRRARGAGLRVQIQTVLTRRNRHEVEPLLDLCRTLDVESITFRRLIVEMNGRGTPDEIDLDPSDFRALYEEIVRLREAGSDDLVIRTVGLKALPGPRDCGAGRNIFIVDGEGFVHPCLVLRVPQHASRSLHARSAEEILATSTLSRLASPRRPGCVPA